MLQSLFSGGIDRFQLIIILLRVPCVLIALTVHELCHGYAAYRLGDPTARNLGRLTLNPLKHLDPIGTICLLFLGFGWAKPVPINTRYFRNFKRDTALTAAAGPASNLLLGLFGAIVTRLVGFMPTGSFSYALYLFFYVFSYLNFALALFNLIPVPPFDGSRILFVFLPNRLYFGIMRYERYIMIGMLILLWTGVITLPLGAASDFLYRLGYNLFYIYPVS